MIKLTKLNNDEIIINSAHIQLIELIPESKIILTNKEYYIVRETADEIIDKVTEYNAKIHEVYKTIFVK